MFSDDNHFDGSDDSDGGSLITTDTRITLNDPPPAYEDLSRPVSILTNHTDLTLPAVDTSPNSSRPFPLRFNVYYKSSHWKTIICHIGEHADQPCNVIVLKFGWKGPALTLHKTADMTSDVLATANYSSWKPQLVAGMKASIIILPATPASCDEEISEQLHAHTGLASRRYSFSIRVPVEGDKPRVEHFEWRITHGKEVRSLDQRGWGWKLVRLDKDTGTVKQGGSRSARNVGESSDGKELVAVWAGHSRTSRNKLGKFQFVGSGATGELGDKWAVMAVMTILRILQMLRLGRSEGAPVAA